jgi:hypothetical protein
VVQMNLKGSRRAFISAPGTRHLEAVEERMRLRRPLHSAVHTQ